MNFKDATFHAANVAAKILPKGSVAKYTTTRLACKALDGLGFGVTGSDIVVGGEETMAHTLFAIEEAVKASVRTSGKSRRELCREIDLGYSTLTSWLSGTMDFSFERVTLIADAIKYQLPSFDVPKVTFVFTEGDE